MNVNLTLTLDESALAHGILELEGRRVRGDFDPFGEKESDPQAAETILALAQKFSKDSVKASSPVAYSHALWLYCPNCALQIKGVQPVHVVEESSLCARCRNPIRSTVPLSELAPDLRELDGLRAQRNAVIALVEELLATPGQGALADRLARAIDYNT